MPRRALALRIRRLWTELCIEQLSIVCGLCGRLSCSVCKDAEALCIVPLHKRLTESRWGQWSQMSLLEQADRFCQRTGRKRCVHLPEARYFTELFSMSAPLLRVLRSWSVLSTS